jgi:para-nitrobenzyl esterase
MRLGRQVAALAAVLVVAGGASAAAAPVRTSLGLVEGVQEDGVTVYKGVPFAAPPVGELRWRPPQPARPWTGVRRADAYPRRCMQEGNDFGLPGPGDPMSEDCLYLNIWTPDHRPGARLPVMVWIYGGGFQNGSASDPIYRGGGLARKGVVIIGINYRVGVLGFLAYPGLTAESPHHASGNYGLMDMVAALTWIRANAAAFGGDPRNVTVFGQSAGSAAVSLLTASPLARGLFEKAIGESGGQFRPPASHAGPARLADAEKAGLRMAEVLGARSVAELRALPAEKLAAAGPARPVVDGYVVPSPIWDIYAAGRQNDVPILVGDTDGEGDNLTPNPVSASRYAANVRATFGAEADRVLALYPAGSDEQAAKSQRALQRDWGFGWEMWTWARLQTRTGRRPAFLYYFDRRPPFPDSEPFRTWGVAHGAEIYYAFRNYDPAWKWTEAEKRYSDVVSGYWVNFARRGDPNGPGLPPWPRYARAANRVMLFGATPRAAPLPHIRALRLFDRIAARMRAER